MTHILLPLLCLLCVCASAADQPIAPGTVVWTLDLAAAAQKNHALPAGAAWGTDGPAGAASVRLSLPAGKAGATGVRFPIDLRSWRGSYLTLTCQAKADGVSKPGAAYNGVKCMLSWKSPSGARHHNENGVFGTFDWKTLSCNIPVDADAGDAELTLGLQDSHGTVGFAQVQLIMLKQKPIRPEPRADAPPPFRGHDLPRLRGVMSPNHVSEEDFAELARWNVNVIRWQLTRNWGAWDAGKATEQDLDEYDRWLDGKLADVDKVLVLAKRHGIRVVIDLHSPPGGRTKDGTMVMTQEARFQDHFVQCWERMAKRFKGHPAVWAYDLINEPAQNRPSPVGVADWLGMQVRAAKAVRAIDAQTPIMITVDGWGGPTNFGWLAAVDVPRVIYQVHMYEPGSYTHQGVHGTMPDPLRPYPGMIDNRMADKEALRRFLQPVREFQRAYNVHIYVGEFSAIRWAPGADRYLADCIDLFEEYGWDWTHHAFREWPGWSIEYADAPASKDRHEKAVGDTARGKVLKGWWAKNVRKPE